MVFENRMRHVVDGDYTPHSAVIFLLRILVWLPIPPKPCTSRAIGLNSIEYVHQRQ